MSWAQITVETVGWIGTATVVLAYLAVSLHLARPDIGFQVANLIGSAALLINGAYHGALPSVGVNGAWLIISVIAIVRTAISRFRWRHTDAPRAGNTREAAEPSRGWSD